MEDGLLPITQHALRFYGHVGYHDFEGPAVELDERARLAVDLGAHHSLILRNHGLLTCAGTIAEAFNLHYQLEMACKVQVDVMAMNGKIVLPTPEVMRKTAYLFEPQVRRPYGVMEWEAMLRLLDREDLSYKE
jgi:ribulose-5-phosphate 4-epimerase/fuculose-1-phosphate aldolase